MKYVRLRYRHLTQFEDYKTVEMTMDPRTRKHTGTVPGSFIIPKWDLMFFVEAMPEQGVGRRIPDLEHEMPYVIVPVKR